MMALDKVALSLEGEPAVMTMMSEVTASTVRFV